MFLVIHWDVEDDTDEDMESRSREEISEDLKLWRTYSEQLNVCLKQSSVLL